MLLVMGCVVKQPQGDMLAAVAAPWVLLVAVTPGCQQPRLQLQCENMLHARRHPKPCRPQTVRRPMAAKTAHDHTLVRPQWRVQDHAPTHGAPCATYCSHIQL